MELNLAFSTCPNDTFTFEAMVNGRIDTNGITYNLTLADIFNLNQMAIEHKPDIVKISYNTYGLVMDEYELLDSGSALGHGCGPLLISKRPLTVEEIIENKLTVAIPGLSTTANLLLTFFAPKIRNKKEMLFHDIMPAILNGEADAGVIIHENRFTYQEQGLMLIQDLGAHWEKVTGLPIPLGAIVAKRSLGQETIRKIEKQIRESVAFAFQHREIVQPFVGKHAQEMSPDVQQAHINLYVNDFSLSLGEKGREAVSLLLKVGRTLGYYE
ncbi:MAG: 1,4-dihydroxy-6-naphthoate synthase [Bacteroidia bacterium]|nr:1,4-dihydroxy-6-naphthoate synthase [Bacteroidia bacterium]